jgi:hypothetical protein
VAFEHHLVEVTRLLGGEAPKATGKQRCFGRSSAEGNGKAALLRAIERASRVVPLSVALRIARRLLPATTAGARGRVAKAAAPCLPSEAQGEDSC